MLLKYHLCEAAEEGSQDLFLPLFFEGCKEEVEASITDSEKLPLELAMGVPLHYQNSQRWCLSLPADTCIFSTTYRYCLHLAFERKCWYSYFALVK